MCFTLYFVRFSAIISMCFVILFPFEVTFLQTHNAQAMQALSRAERERDSIVGRSLQKTFFQQVKTLPNVL